MPNKKGKHPGVEPLDEPGRFRLRIRVRNRRTGKNVNTMVHFRGTLRQAKVERKRLMAQFAEGEKEVRESGRMTLGIYAGSWIESRKKEGEKYSTRRLKIHVLNKRILPYFGDWYVEAIARMDVKEWRDRMSEEIVIRPRKADQDSAELPPKTVSPVTVNVWLRIFKAMVAAYFDDYNLGPSPIARVKPLKVRRRKKDDPNSLPAELLPKVLARFKEAYPQHYAMLYIGMTTGMRWSELSALEWDDVDMEQGVLNSTRAQVRGHVDTRKTDDEIEFPLLPEMAEVLRWHRRRLIEQQSPGLGKGLVFPSKLGGYSFASRFSKPLESVRKELGIPYRLTSKVMRRTFNNLLRKAAVDRLVLRSLTGHSSETMTEQYSTVASAEQWNAVATVVRIAESGEIEDK